jgi:hypothetical protein
VRVAEYYRKEQKADKLCAFIIPEGFQDAGQQVIVAKSEMTPDQKLAYEIVKKEDSTQERDIVSDEITWYKIAGNSIIDERPWLGKYVPLVRVIGEETIIEGKMDRKGHTRAMKDAQRMYNYWTSEATAQVALQTKTPWVAPAEAIEGLEEYWGKANLDSVAVLPYNGLGEDGAQIAPPKREQPPIMATAYVQGMQISQDQMMMTSGQYQSQFGQNENATSGKAINERQRQGDNATYHFIDNLAIGIRFTGKIMIDLIPKVYDTDRVIRIMAKDGTESDIQIKPDANDAYQQMPSPPDQGQKLQQQVAAIFNPNVGRYEVESDIGPGYATRRQEAFNAMTQIAAQNPEFMKIAGDLLWRSADFPLADELAERWARTIPPTVLGDGPSPQEQQMQQQMDMLQQAIVKLQKDVSDKSADQNIKAYDAETKRITAIGNSPPAITPEQIAPAFQQLLLQMLQTGSPEGSQSPINNMAQPQNMPVPDQGGNAMNPQMQGAA